MDGDWRLGRAGGERKLRDWRGIKFGWWRLMIGRDLYFEVNKSEVKREVGRKRWGIIGEGVDVIEYIGRLNKCRYENCLV